MSENSPQDPLLPANEGRLGPGASSPNDETERGDYTRGQHRPVSPDSFASSAPLGQAPAHSGRGSPRTARERQSMRAGGAEGSRRGTLPPPQSLTPQGHMNRSPRQGGPPPSANGLYFPWWSLVLLVMLVGAIAIGFVAVSGQLMEPALPGNQPARVQVVTSLPTLSQDFVNSGAGGSNSSQTLWPTPIPMAQPSPTAVLPTPIPSPSLPPGNIMIGVRVRVVGVGTSGLNIRSVPGYTGSPRFLAAENEEFVVVDGPQRVDDLEWWRVENPGDANRYGWAARNYLAVTSQ